MHVILVQNVLIPAEGVPVTPLLPVPSLSTAYISYTPPASSSALDAPAPHLGVVGGIPWLRVQIGESHPPTVRSNFLPC
jgi:hypothetical protein